MLIRQATLTDVADISRVHIDSWRKSYKSFMGETILQQLNEHQRMRFWQQIIADGKGKIILAIENSELLGFCHFSDARDADVDKAGEIIALYIAPHFYRQGLGSTLVQRAQKELAAKGHTMATIWSLQDNLDGIAFLHEHGFQSDGKLDRSVHQNLVEVRFRKGLPSLG